MTAISNNGASLLSSDFDIPSNNLWKENIQNGCDFSNSSESCPSTKLHNLVEAACSVESRSVVECLARQVQRLSNLERLLLYLKLPSLKDTDIDTLKIPLNPLGSRSEIQQTIVWIRTHLEEDSEVSMPKHEVYDEYQVYCANSSMKGLSTADFGKVMKQVFPRVRPRRLGMRGHSRYCYAGLRRRVSLSPPALADLGQLTSSAMASIADSVTARVASDSCELGTDPIGPKLAPSESTLIQDWAEKMTGIKFDTMSQFTDYLLKKNYACSGLAGPTTGVTGAQPAVVGPVGSERTPGGGAATPPAVDRHRETQLQLQRKIHEKEIARDNRKRFQEMDVRPASGRGRKRRKFSSTEMLPVGPTGTVGPEEDGVAEPYLPWPDTAMASSLTPPAIFGTSPFGVPAAAAAAAAAAALNCVNSISMSGGSGAVLGSQSSQPSPAKMMVPDRIAQQQQQQNLHPSQVPHQQHTPPHHQYPNHHIHGSNAHLQHGHQQQPRFPVQNGYSTGLTIGARGADTNTESGSLFEHRLLNYFGHRPHLPNPAQTHPHLAQQQQPQLHVSPHHHHHHHNHHSSHHNSQHGNGTATSVNNSNSITSVSGNSVGNVPSHHPLHQFHHTPIHHIAQQQQPQHQMHSIFHPSFERHHYQQHQQQRDLSQLRSLLENNLPTGRDFLRPGVPGGNLVVGETVSSTVAAAATTTVVTSTLKTPSVAGVSVSGYHGDMALSSGVVHASAESVRSSRGQQLLPRTGGEHWVSPSGAATGSGGVVVNSRVATPFSVVSELSRCATVGSEHSTPFLSPQPTPVPFTSGPIPHHAGSGSVNAITRTRHSSGHQLSSVTTASSCRFDVAKSVTYSDNLIHSNTAISNPSGLTSCQQQDQPLQKASVIGGLLPGSNNFYTPLNPNPYSPLSSHLSYVDEVDDGMQTSNFPTPDGTPSVRSPCQSPTPLMNVPVALPALGITAESVGDLRRRHQSAGPAVLRKTPLTSQLTESVALTAPAADLERLVSDLGQLTPEMSVVLTANTMGSSGGGSAGISCGSGGEPQRSQSVPPPSCTTNTSLYNGAVSVITSTSSIAGTCRSGAYNSSDTAGSTVADLGRALEVLSECDNSELSKLMLNV